jgi:hypothetical protein
VACARDCRSPLGIQPPQADPAGATGTTVTVPTTVTPVAMMGFRVPPTHHAQAPGPGTGRHGHLHVNLTPNAVRAGPWVGASLAWASAVVPCPGASDPTIMLLPCTTHRPGTFPVPVQGPAAVGGLRLPSEVDVLYQPEGGSGSQAPALQPRASTSSWAASFKLPVPVASVSQAVGTDTVVGQPCAASDSDSESLPVQTQESHGCGNRQGNLIPGPAPAASESSLSLPVGRLPEPQLSAVGARSLAPRAAALPVPVDGRQPEPPSPSQAMPHWQPLQHYGAAAASTSGSDSLAETQRRAFGALRQQLQQELEVITALHSRMKTAVASRKRKLRRERAALRASGCQLQVEPDGSACASDDPASGSTGTTTVGQGHWREREECRPGHCQWQCHRDGVQLPASPSRRQWSGDAQPASEATM